VSSALMLPMTGRLAAAWFLAITTCDMGLSCEDTRARNLDAVGSCTCLHARGQRSSSVSKYVPDPQKMWATDRTLLISGYGVMPVPSDGIASNLITAGQGNIGVWVRRAVSVAAWSRCHLVCHWLRDLLPP
jgi:hypothetical protein